jgi:hypothetical protein
MEPREYLFGKKGAAFGPQGVANLFYPGGFTDHGPLDLLLGHYQSVESVSNGVVAVYVDYWMTFEALEEFIQNIGMRYQAECSLSIELTCQDFGVNSISAFYPKTWTEDQVGFYLDSKQTHLGFRYFFPAINLTLIYLKAEAIETYKLLQKNKIYPNLVVLQDHGGYGGAWTDFGGDSALYKSAKVKPKYLYVADNTRTWPGYNKVSDGFCDEGQAHRFIRSIYESQR